MAPWWGALLVGAVALAASQPRRLPPAPSVSPPTPDGKCPLDDYQCDDGRCIPNGRCSSVYTCEDLCENITTCRKDHFECTLTKKCIPIGWVCDGNFDCGHHETLGTDSSDEADSKCFAGVKCPPNEERCRDMMTCIPIEQFCDGQGHCPDNSDEWDVCRNTSITCDGAKCIHGCRVTYAGPTCFCPNGQMPENEKCVDLNECDLDMKCDQICHNTIGSFQCSCVSGYELFNSSHCKAINDPIDEEPSLIFSTQRDINRVKLDGTAWEGNSSLKLINSRALDFNFANRTICYIHNKVTNFSFSCSNIDDLNDKWLMPNPSMFPELDSIHQLSLDWISGNWYFLDDHKEIILICNSTLSACDILLEVDLSKPRGIALDPTKGLMFFTKWGRSAPALERCTLNGLQREAIVNWKIVYPFGVTVDIPTGFVYWVDTYLNFVERVDYNGKHRKIIKQGSPIYNLYSVAIFELTLFVTSLQSLSLIKLNKPNAEDKELIKGNNFSHPNSVYVVHRQRQPLVPHPCRIHNGGCDHLCIPAYRNETNLPYALCMCKPGYRLRGHGECTLSNKSYFLIYGKGKPSMIKAISPSPKDNYQVMVPITDVIKPTAIDFDYKDQYIYFSDVQKNTIQRQQINGPNREIILSGVKDGLRSIGSCEGLAVDWISRLLYWTDETLHTVGVISLLDFEKKKTLIYDADSNPRSIVLDPKNGFMFWTDWKSKQQKSGKIVRAWMDGKNSETIVNSDLQLPSGLTIDSILSKLYWCDMYLERIESINTDGTNRVRLRSLEWTARPYGLTFHSGFLFWTEFNKGIVRRLNINNNSLDILSIENPPLFDIKVYDGMSQLDTNKCSSQVCAQLCLAVPNDAVCACADGYELSETTCVPIQNYTTPSRCHNGLFKCKNGLCINKNYVCDGDNDCKDNSDEDATPGGACENIKCHQDKFQCDLNRCINQFWVCDGDKDCIDGTDEDAANCKNSTCSSVQFRCLVSGRCIPMAWKCDSEKDCGENDNSDEPDDCDYPRCQSTEFTCDNKHCIKDIYNCDGYDDCSDGSDEKNCPDICDSKTMIFCPPHGGCFPIQVKCDGVKDCPDGSDEVDCVNVTGNYPTPIHPNKHSNKTTQKCESHEFQCKNMDCIRKEYVCDTRVDCLDGSDEETCQEMSTVTIPPVTPESIQNDTCDFPSRKCDNLTKCVSPEKLCNDIEDCEDGSDEGLLCGENFCDRGSSCSHLCYNAPEGMVCACPSGLHLQPNQKICSEFHPCTQWGSCSQECQSLKFRHKCICHEGYALADDGFTCKSLDGAAPFIVFSNRHELRGIDLQTFQGKSLIASLKNTIALDFYSTKEANFIYWTDVIHDKIYKGTIIEGSLGNIEVVVQSGLTTAEGLAVDWIAKNLYWVESNLDQIEVAKLNGSFRRTLVAGKMERPRAIALDPRDGILFWTDWEVRAPRIERCTMSGTKRKIVVIVDEVSDGEWPNGLSLDYEARRIYWIDARSDSIHTVTYEGADHRIVLRNHELLSHPFAIGLYENHVYWTDWRSNSVIRANKWNGSDVFAIQKTYTQPFDITIMHPSRQPKVAKNPCENNGGCSHLCLLDENSTYNCACPHVMKLGPDQKNCIVNEKVLLFSRPNEVRGVDLNMPYYHTIPTISMPLVLAPHQLDYVAKSSTLYWSDVQLNEIKKRNLTIGPTIGIIDTGIENPAGFAVDWISDLMFFSSSGTVEHISVCTLKGEYTAMIISSNLNNVTGLAVDPTQGNLFWAHQINDSYVIEMSKMDGSGRSILVSENNDTDLRLPQSLTVDISSNSLYWVNIHSATIQYYDFTKKQVISIPLPEGSKPTALAPYFDDLFYATDHDQAIHVCNKNKCSDDRLLRNNTGNVLSLRIYDATLQIGNNSCLKNRGGCHHLCLPTSPYTRQCLCATGYYSDPARPNRCIGIEELIFYSVNWEIRGLSLKDNDTNTVLGPISHVSLATSVDFLAATDSLYWVDSDHGTINKIKRDGTDRQTLIDQPDLTETNPIDWLSGLTIDWISGNMYWADPKRNVIEVSRLNGSSRYVILSNDLETPTAITIDPVQGLLFYTGGVSIRRAGLDGSNHIYLYNRSSQASITDLTLDYIKKELYWSEAGTRVIMKMNYDGSSQIVLFNHSMENPTSLTFYDNFIYFLDTISESGSIKKVSVVNVSDCQILAKGIGDSLKDVQIFSRQRQKGTNPCASPYNGGCAELCLFDGQKAKCACPHGNIASDGKTCIHYDAFLMYSRRIRIESIHMIDENNLNAPYPTIQNRNMRNTIGLAFDYENSQLFYSDIQKGSINMVFFNGTGYRTLVENQGSVEGIVFDSFTKYLYFTCHNDATINKINVTKALENHITNTYSKQTSQLTGFSSTTESLVERIIKLKTNDKPRGIAIDNCQTKVYWTNWNSNSPSIQRAFVNGFQIESIITTEIVMPNGLTLDLKPQKLYWADVKLHKIERCEYDGSRRVVITKGTPAHPFAIAVYGDSIFWTDWLLRSVVRADKISGLNIVQLRKDIIRPMGIIAVAKEIETCPSINHCKTESGVCSHSCVLTPLGAFVCECHPGYHLASDGIRCLNSTEKCHDSKPSFLCTDGECIPLEATCDGIPHCSDGSDEEVNYCATRKCSYGLFQCVNNRCISLSRVCDKISDCSDGSDEASCSCDGDFFRCTSGQCISSEMRCNMKAECPDVSDEMGCPLTDCLSTRPLGEKIPPDQTPTHRCPHTTPCIHPSWICDGQNDCLDNSDEQNCTVTTPPNQPTCSFDKFTCGSNICIPIQWRCDGEDDCSDSHLSPSGISSDEIDCKHNCHFNQFTCGSGECIPLNWQCDGSPDCTDGSDESLHCSGKECPSYQFKCGNTTRCISTFWICDGEVDCLGGEDESPERGCIPQPCGLQHLQCLNGNCISKHYYCDGDKDCSDGSDEPENCSGESRNSTVCDAGKIACTNGLCIPIQFACDGIDHCGDGSDEYSELCDKCSQGGVLLTDCLKVGACSKSEYACANGVCVNNTVLCDGHDDCGDFSDENKCNINECLNTTICAHNCIDLKIGYACTCKKGYRVSETNKNLCVDIDECINNPCGQVCRNTQGSYVCSCQDGFILKPDHINCKANSRTQASLIFSNRYYIRTMNLGNGQNTLVTHNLSNAVALDFDWSGQCIYWSDVTQHASYIKRLCEMNTTNLSGASANTNYTILHSSTLQSPDGIAVDWVGRNLYWCDKGHDTIEVSRLDGRHRKILLNKGLHEPRAIALDPKHGMMYWTDWGDMAHIGRAGMDGSNPQVIINSSLGWPNALSISHESRELYFADAKEDYIAVSDLEGKYIRILFSKANNPNMNLHHIFAIAIWEDYIYWSDWETKTIERCERHRRPQHFHNGTGEMGNGSCTTMTKLIHKPMDIRLYHPFRQRPIPLRSLRCAQLNCMGMCLLTPGVDEPIAKCACPENFVLDDDGFSCNANCTSAHFLCSTVLKCIPFWWKCDTQDDCGDGSDEPLSCPPFTCKPGQFQCKNHHCIDPAQLCNGEDNCGDHSDEMDCNKFTCLSSQFKCKGNSTISDRCIPGSKRCDKTEDCPNGEDEIDCPPKTCAPNDFLCKNGKCIPKIWVCDTDNDCDDNSDETEQCSNRECSHSFFRCQSGRCIPKSWICDGEKDCNNGEDEPPTCKNISSQACESTYFRCKNNKCIPNSWHCDYDDDCGDRSDEENCSPRNCSESEFLCSDGRCIRGSHQCDGEYNCDDRSDEENCNTSCLPTEFLCQYPKYCITLDWKCDGEADCADGSDELGCNPHTNGTSKANCGHNMFACSSPHGRCIPERWMCDTIDDCGDGSDESTNLCKEHTCLPFSYRCDNIYCLPKQSWCDGKLDCKDKIDENPDSCKTAGLCGLNEFHCANSQCISNSFQCNGKDDCGDMSDEIDCEKSACSFKSCSQLCIEKKGNTFTCKCNTGYYTQKYENKTTCLAFGDRAKLFVTGDADLWILDPYKPGDNSHIHLLQKNHSNPSFKIKFHDILWGPEHTSMFWTEHRLKRIVKLTINTASISQDMAIPRFNYQSIIPIISGMKDPNGIAVEWVAKRLYWTEAGSHFHATGSIGVATIEGRMRTTLIRGLKDPQDIVVSPSTGHIIWSCFGETPQIEQATLSGEFRKVLAVKNIYWPTSLTLDVPALRLYWADPKASAIESMNIDGTNRHMIKKFSFNEKPYKIALFEDAIFISTYFGHNILKIHKFGDQTKVYLVRGLNKVSDITVIQQNVQDQNISNMCEIQPCHPSALCLLNTGPAGRSCLCPDGLIPSKNTSNSEVRCIIGSSTVVSCSLRCAAGGTCVAVDGVESCACAPGYAGPRCERYRCAKRCLNGGTCIPQRNGTLKCACPPLKTGDRCESAVVNCNGQCLNGGTCTINGCLCAFPFGGSNCELCGEIECLNGGKCSVDSLSAALQRSPHCLCPTGWTGRQCDTHVCTGYCYNDDYCSLSDLGKPICHCPQGRSGTHCQDDMCKNFCKNNGVCHVLHEKVACVCPAQFTGPHCEERLCQGNNCEGETDEDKPGMLPREGECSIEAVRGSVRFCENGGTCTKTANSVVCRCPSQWGGPYCEVYIGYDNPCTDKCKNNAVCFVDSQGPARCHCMVGWRGDACEMRDPCLNYCHPHNGICQITLLGEAKCICLDDFTGPLCMNTHQQIADETTRQIWTGVGVTFVLALLVIGAASALFLVYKRRSKSFNHSHLQDNIEINNPIYLQGGLEEEVDPLDRGFISDKTTSHFANPIYDSLYTGGTSSIIGTSFIGNNSNAQGGPKTSEERTGLLQNTQEPDQLS